MHYRSERGGVNFNSDVNNICRHLSPYYDCGESLLGRTHMKQPCYLVELTRLLKGLQRRKLVLPKKPGTADKQEHLELITLRDNPDQFYFVSGNKDSLLTKLVKGIANLYLVFLEKKKRQLSLSTYWSERQKPHEQ